MLIGEAILCDVDSIVVMATGESVAHLNCLIERGQVVRDMDDAGVAWYQATPSARSALSHT